MTPLFTINFSRQAFLNQVARRRRRVVLLSLWVTYFGIIGITMGLYGLNCASLTQRVRLLERQAARLESAQTEAGTWQLPAAELAHVEQSVGNARQWHDRLLRVVQLLPSDARIASMAVNPNNVSTGRDQQRLVITGHFRSGTNERRMAGVMSLVGALRSDSTFAASYGNIKLASTRIAEGSPPMTEFVIECQ